MRSTMSVLMGLGVGMIVYGLTKEPWLAFAAGCFGFCIWMAARRS
jgi:hypothetical protein